MKSSRKRCEEFDYSFKVIILGDISVGKSKLGERYCLGCYSPSYKTTLGFDVLEKLLNVDGTRVRLQMWDTAGQERYRTLTSSFYRGAMGVLLLYDITALPSFHSLPGWIENVREYSFADISIVLVGSKSDLDSAQKVDEKSALQFANEHDLCHYLVSSKTGDNVEEAFLKLTRLMLQTKYQRRKSATAKLYESDQDVDKGRGQCSGSCQ